MDLTSYLREGDNCIAVMVLRYPEARNKGNHSTIRTHIPGLYLVGEVCEEDGKKQDISANGSWHCRIDKLFQIVPEEKLFAPLMIHEETKGNPQIFGWMNADYDDADWEMARPYIRVEVPGSVSPGNLNARTIPYMYRKKKNFQKVFHVAQSTHEEKEWNEFLHNGQGIIIPGDSVEVVEIDAGEEMTGYLRMVFEGGKNAVVEILQAEGYVQDQLVGPAQVPKKGDRLDKLNGHLDGYKDIYYVAGLSNGEQQEFYEPFWFRTFRFIRLKITTAEEALKISSFDYEETGYPLEVRTVVETSDHSLKNIWDISERTLRRCMHETYEDCPFYEQLQYIMDSRLQMLYTYGVSADDRLARKCMDDFRRSQRYDGLLNGSYPNCNPNVIPGFSIYYILMLYDHMMYFADANLIKEHMPTVDRILNFFSDRLTEKGYVDKIGGENLEGPFWSFIDWAKEWIPTTGMPRAGLAGPLTMESLLFILGLQKGAELAAFLCNNDQEESYRRQAQRIQESIRQYCIGNHGMIQDGPGIEEYSQQCQVFGVLTDTIEMQTGKDNLLKTVENRQKYTQCTVAMGYYLFRALEKANLYEYTDRYWDVWRNMLENHCTTCVESEAYARSECHGWGALALFELPCAVLGVRPAAPGYKKVRIRPMPGNLNFARGTVRTPLGDIKVSWEKQDGILKTNYEIPSDIEVVP